MAPFDRPCTTFYWSAIVSIAVCCTILSYLTLNNRDFERSLNVIETGTIRKLGCGFLFAFHSMSVSLTVYEIFSVKEERDLENRVSGCSRSLKLTPFDRSYETFYWYDIVTIALSCTVL